MSLPDLDALGHAIVERAHAIQFELPEPAAIEYGFGWEPTISFWYGSRRVHCYFDQDAPDGLAIEVADLGPPSEVRYGIVHTTDAVWEVIDRFLRQGCELAALPDAGWNATALDHDKFIPHPPNAPNPANIVDFIQGNNVWQFNPQPSQPRGRKEILRQTIVMSIAVLAIIGLLVLAWLIQA